MRTDHSRRRFLQVTFALAGTGVGYSVAAQDAEPDIELEGRVEGWQGIAPDDIEGEENPTLTLVEGEDYVLEWTNGDGQPHNFVVETEEDEDVFATDLLTTGSQTVEFTASEEMSEYYCQPHAGSMRGDVELVDDPSAEGAIEPAGTSDDGGDGGDEGAEDDQPTAEDAEVTVEFVLTEEGWEGQAPDGIEGEMNPTLRLEAGTVYEIAIETEIGREEHQIGHALAVVDEDGQHVANTALLQEGQEGSLVFTAEESVDRYLDQTQLEIGGDIDVVGGDGDDADDGGDDEEPDDDPDEEREEREEGQGETADDEDERIGGGIYPGDLR